MLESSETLASDTLSVVRVGATVVSGRRLAPARPTAQRGSRAIINRAEPRVRVTLRQWTLFVEAPLSKSHRRTPSARRWIEGGCQQRGTANDVQRRPFVPRISKVTYTRRLFVEFTSVSLVDRR